jgi:hypothetical protein
VLRPDELLSIDDDAVIGADRDRQEAIACCLSGSQGWDEATQRLDGAFASAATGLTERKAD